jgi:serine/threonine protein kinase/tetratricopeptide (TPR) repeat protein
VLAVGTQLGRYRIIALLGAGGMGEVYRARDTRLGREVAVKVLPEQFAQDVDRVARFEREAKAVAALAHPNLLAIHDYGTADGRSFAVMELLEGETLRSRLRSAPLPWRQALEMGVAIAEGLAAAHAKGIIHRDIKPENLILTSDGRVKILDFGLARMAPEPPAGLETGPYLPALTASGVVVGTPAYMAPEQVSGDKVDARCDLFALGSVLYEALIGRSPFARDTRAATLAAILNEDPPMPVAPADPVPPAIGPVIRHCLEKNPEERFQSARDLAFALRAILNASGAPTAPTECEPRPRQSSDPAPAARPSVAVLPFINADGEAALDYLSEGLTEGTINQLGRVPGVRVMARATVYHFRGKDQDPRAVGAALGVSAVLTGRVRQHDGRIMIDVELIDVTDGSQLWGAQYRRPLTDLAVLQGEMVRELIQRLRLRLTGEEQARLNRGGTEDTDAYRAYLKGRYFWNKRTLEEVQTSVRYFEQALAADPNYARAYAGLADAYAYLGGSEVNAVAPAEAFAKAWPAILKALAIDSGLAEAHASVANANLHYNWQWPDAEAELRRAIQLNPDYETAHHWASHYWLAMGRTDLSLAASLRSLELAPIDNVLNAHLAWHYLFARQPDGAMEQARKTLELEPNSPSAAWLLGLGYEQARLLSQAIKQLRKAVAVSKGNPTMIASLGRAYALAGKRDQVRSLLGQLKELSGRLYVSPYEVALIHAGLGENDQAFTRLQEAYAHRSGGLAYLAVDPRLDGLRSDGRFAELLRRVGLPPRGAPTR